jgi:hypothetical protein
MTLPEDLRQLLLAFNEHGVEYLVVGGWAVGFYSEPRSTKNIDLLIRSGVKNSEAVYRALAKYGAPLQVSLRLISGIAQYLFFKSGSRLWALTSCSRSMGSNSTKHGLVALSFRWMASPFT